MKKMLDIEIMRIVAIFLVLFHHMREGGPNLYLLYDPNTIRYFVYQFMSVFCKCAVNIFFMISGALLFAKSYNTINDIKELWTKKILHTFFLLLIWSMFYKIPFFHTVESFNIENFLRNFYNGEVYVHLWFLYSYIAFLMTLPILKKVADALTNVEYVYMFALIIILMMIVPMIDNLISYGKMNMTGNIKPLWLSIQIFIAPLLGYFLMHKIENFWTNKKIIILWIINIVTILISCYITYLKTKNLGIQDESSHTMFSLINAATIFISIQYLVKKIKRVEYLRVPLTKLGSSVFFIYVAHIKTRDFLVRKFIQPYMNNHFNGFLPMPYTILLCLIVILVDFVIFLVFSRIPILKKLVISS